MNSVHSTARHLYRQFRPPLDRLVFLHLPKCGGTSINLAIENAYKNRFHKTVHLDPQQSKFVSDMFSESLEEFRTLLLAYHVADGLQGCRYISGHYVFDERILQAFADTWRFMTVLRDPVPRWYSAYFYNRHKTNSNHMRINESLEIFVQTERAKALGSLYVRQLTGYKNIANAPQQALDNLKQFHLVGLLEHMEILVQDFQKLMGIRLNIPRQNVNPRTPQSQSEEITPEIHEQVLRLCEPDLQIYKAVKEKITLQNTWLS